MCMTNVEEILIRWLNANTSIDWFGDVPADRPKQFGTVERTGGGISDVVIDSPMIALQVWAESRDIASNLAYDVARIVPKFAYEDRICKVSINSIYNYPDPDSGSARYQIVVDMKTVQRAD